MSGSSNEAVARRGILEQRLSLKSIAQYERVYENFMRWKSDHNAYSMKEDVFEAYFRKLAKVKKSSTLWCFYRMIKYQVRLKHNIDIGNYKNLLSFLKSTSTGFTPTMPTTKVLTEENIQKFLKEAPEPQYLLIKVVLILGICGACRNIEIRNLTLDDLETFSDKIIVHLKCSNTRNSRMFVVEGELLKYIKKYQEMRPVGVQTNRFLLNIRRGKCISQVVGVHRIAKYPRDIAKYLGLINAEAYTGSCFRRSSKTLWCLATPSMRASQRLKYSLKKGAGDCMEDSMEIQTKRIKRSASENEVYFEEQDNDPLLTSQALENEADLYINDSMGDNPKIKIEVDRFSEGHNDESMGNESEPIKSLDREADKYFKGTMEHNIEMGYEINQDTPAQTSTETPTETLASSAKNATQSVHNFNLDGKTINMTFNSCKSCNVIFKVEK